ncbi:MAG: hypothetical protein JKX78_04600 [Alteromonadaceae bacterium]|nr:hypothetical protein [Alteromonadaceae bacterium]
MSENRFNIYAKPNGLESEEALINFIKNIKCKNFEALSYAEEYCEVKKYLDIELKSTKIGEVYNLKFEALGSLTVEDFISLLVDELDMDVVEASIFIGDCGEYDFQYADKEEDDSFTEYDEHEWEWLENPSIDWESENIVLSGKFENYDTRDELAEELIDYGSNVQSSISKKTTLLITGSKVGASKLKKATDLNIRVITESELMQFMDC